MRTPTDRSARLHEGGRRRLRRLRCRRSGCSRSSRPMRSSPRRTRSRTAAVASPSSPRTARSCSPSPLPDRGHDVTYDPIARRSVVFARRPEPSPWSSTTPARLSRLTITSPPGRHFFGHGVFSPDGALLYATENDFENAAGMIGIYDATAGFRAHRRVPHPRHGRARNAAARRRPHAGDRQWRHRDASGFRPRQAQHRDHEAVLRLRRPR